MSGSTSDPDLGSSSENLLQNRKRSHGRQRWRVDVVLDLSWLAGDFGWLRFRQARMALGLEGFLVGSKKSVSDVVGIARPAIGRLDLRL